MVRAVVLWLLSSTVPAWAGCPTMPEEQVTIEIACCRFYDASEDNDFARRLDMHFADGFELSDQAIAELKRELVAQNTGAIAEASPTGGEEAHLYFLRSSDKDACKQLPAGEAVTVIIQPTCPMVAFEAPAEWIIRLRGEQGDDGAQQHPQTPNRRR